VPTIEEMLRLSLFVVALVGMLTVAAAPASAAKVIDRGTKWQSIKVDRHHVAEVTYFAHGHTMHVLLWGAVNALPPNPAHPRSQVKFNVNYSGGYGTSFGAGYWKRVARHNVCRPYTGEALWHMVAACTMHDGSHWALQTWQGMLPDNGWPATSSRESAPELFVSHWSGPLPQLWFKADWAYAGTPNGPYDNIYGRLSYRGHPVYGFASTGRGAPTDSYGRLISLDTRNPPWHSGYRQTGGWYRQNAFLAHHPGGDFCAGVFGAIAGVRTRPVPGRGDAYRVIANGPGVTPVVEWTGAPPGYYQPGLSDLFPTLAQRGRYDAGLNAALAGDQVALARGGTCSHTH
jgi:hypothetical protein